MSRLLKISSFINKYTLSSLLRRQYASGYFEPFYNNFFRFSDNIAVVDNLGAHKYKDILYSSYLIAKKIDKLVPSGFKTCERISFLCLNQSTYVAVLLACWISGNIAVPLCSSHPETLLEYYIVDSQSSVVIASDSCTKSVKSIAAKLNINYFTISSFLKESVDGVSSLEQSKFFSWDSNYIDRKALIIYTSGSTGPPKGVVLTHGNLYFQVSKIIEITFKNKM